MKENTTSNIILSVLGISIFILFFSLNRLSFYFKTNAGYDEKQVLLIILILIIASAAYLLSIKIVSSWNILTLVIIILFGILFRLLLIYSQPVLEDDYFRYLWDGAVLANKHNPYKFSPEEIIEKKSDADLSNLAESSGDIIRKINHPHLKTIYPPVAQFFFALSYKISPWNLYTWKFILFFSDLLTLSLLLLLFVKLKIPLIYILIYWWNPLLIKEIFNSGHMDCLLFPFVLVSLLLYVHNRRSLSSFLISLAVGLKIWPVFLYPAYLKPLLNSPGKLILNLIIFLLPIAVFVMIILGSKPDFSSGFVAYGLSWENNSSIFRIILNFTESILATADIHPGHAQKYSRIAITFILGIWILYWGLINKSRDIFSKCLIILAFAFLISPTQFPWYYTWLLPFLAIKPRWSLLSLTLLLQLYYLSYYFIDIGKPELFEKYVIWIEFVPAWILISAEYIKSRKKI